MNWLREMFSGPSGEVSSKRFILFLLVFLFVSMVICSQIFQMSFDEILKTQLFWLIQTTLILVFGERALVAWEAISKKISVDKVTKTETSETKTETSGDKP
jgi:hypothetical protein